MARKKGSAKRTSKRKKTKKPARTKVRRKARAPVSAKTARPRAAAPVAKPTIFISYKHANPTTAIARRLYSALRLAADHWGADLFMDEHDAEPADLLDETLLGALDRATHFVALLSVDYWNSAYCRKEISRAVQRFAKDRGSLRPLFVKADEFNIDHMLLQGHELFGGVRDFIFLGPYDDAGKLVPIAWESPGQMNRQIAQLVDSIGRSIEP